MNNVIIPECGDLLLTDLTVLRCNRILQHIRDTKSLSAARKARSMFSQICATGIEHGVLAFNPVRDARALPMPPKKESVLTPGQLETLRELLRFLGGWNLRCGRCSTTSGRPDVNFLGDFGAQRTPEWRYDEFIDCRIDQRMSVT